MMEADPPAWNESQAQARQKLVSLCRAMLAGEVSFFEGAIQVCALPPIGASESDPDLMAFVAIRSETDHLPPIHSQHLWSVEAIQRLQPEFAKTEYWAKTFAPKACERLIRRFAES